MSSEPTTHHDPESDDPGPDTSAHEDRRSVQRSDPAASMSLLNQLLNNPLDAGYHAYAEDSHRANLSWSRAILILALAVVLGLGATLAVRNLRTPTDDTVVDTLVDRAQQEQSTAQQLEDDVSTLSSQVRDASKQLPQSKDSVLSTSLTLLSAQTTVTGPGLTVTLQDAVDSALDSSSSTGAVRDTDLSLVVNALWSGGAEAVSINDQRIGPGTFIREAGSILVNITPIQSPYVVRAVGDSDRLSTALIQGKTGDDLSTIKSVRGIRISTKSQSSLTMTALDVRSPEYAIPFAPTSSGG